MSEIDLDALQEAYNTALELEKAGKFDEAAEGYRKALALDPDDHVGSVGCALPPCSWAHRQKKAPVAYVATLFDQHAAAFEKILVDDLGYACSHDGARNDRWFSARAPLCPNA